MRLVSVSGNESATESKDDGRLLFAVNLRITAFRSRIEIQEQITGVRPANLYVAAGEANSTPETVHLFDLAERGIDTEASTNAIKIILTIDFFIFRIMYY